MNQNIIIEAKKAAHVVAQGKISGLLLQEYDGDKWTRKDQLRLRQDTLDHLVEAGFPRCLIAIDESEYGSGHIIGVDCVWHKDEMVDEEGSWFTKAVWSVPEVEAYRAAYRPIVDADDLTSLCWWNDRGAYSSGPGRPFSHGGNVYQRGGHIIHTQSGGWDI